jgi:hypothetical protein
MNKYRFNKPSDSNDLSQQIELPASPEEVFNFPEPQIVAEGILGRNHKILLGNLPILKNVLPGTITKSEAKSFNEFSQKFYKIRQAALLFIKNTNKKLMGNLVGFFAMMPMHRLFIQIILMLSFPIYY